MGRSEMNMPEMNMEQMQQMMMEQKIKQKLGYLSPVKYRELAAWNIVFLLSSHFKGSVPCSYCVFIYFTTYFRCYHQRTA